jgi:hypothetical protein
MHPLPPVLTGGPTAVTVMIGFLPAWRGIGGPAAAAIQAANQAATTAIQTAEAATKAAAPTPGGPAALAAEQALKASLLASMSSMISGSGTDIHVCATPSPVPPHGPGVGNDAFDNGNDCQYALPRVREIQSLKQSDHRTKLRWAARM